MHPELLSSLADEHRRDLAAGRRTGRAPVSAQTAARPRRARRVPLPSLRVSWTHTTLAAAVGRRRGRSLVIVISATRMV
jgi:hypothetical protein